MDNPFPKDPEVMSRPRMALEGALELAQGPEDLLGKETLAGQRRILNRAGVALAHDEPVPILPLRILEIQPHEVEIEGSHDVRRRQRSSGMTRASVVAHLHHVAAQPIGLPLQFLNQRL